MDKELPIFQTREKVLYGGLLAIILFDSVQLATSWKNPILAFTAGCTLAAGLVSLAAHFRDWRFKEWTIVLFFVPLVLMSSDIVTIAYTAFNKPLIAAGEASIPSVVPPADYRAELYKHLWQVLLGPFVRVLALLCKWRCK